MSVTLGNNAHDQFVVSHGKGGAVGLFTTPDPLRLNRGQRVLVHSARGVEIGTVLCEANQRQAFLLGAVPAGTLLRSCGASDQAQLNALASIEQDIFETSRAWALRDGLALEILDVEMLFDGTAAVVQFVGSDEPLEDFAHALERHFALNVRLENLVTPAPLEEEHHACDKPDCGKQAGGGCTDCGTGGGCSSCGSGKKVDMREYFGHLRTKMEETHRIPIL